MIYKLVLAVVLLNGFARNAVVFSSTRTCSASICAHGDNDLGVSVSYDGGSSYESLSYKAGWGATTELEMTDFSYPATLRFEVDDYDHTGGFMATVSVECDDGYEATFITDKGNTMFDVVYALSGNTVMSEFYKFGEEGANNWITRVNSETVECMSTDAYWMWNGVDTDNVVFELDLVPTMCSASICAHGDNELDVSVSYDGGSTYESLSNQPKYWVTTELEMTDFSPPATLRFEVDDYKHTGGFIATVSVECDDGYEATFITDNGNTMFDVVSALSGNTVMSEFYKFGEEGANGWIKNVNSETVECMNADAYWMWNGLNTDDVVFELDLFSSADTAVSAASVSVPLNEQRRGHGHDDLSWKMPMDIDRTARNMPMDSAMVVLQLKDILIICLVIANVIALTILAAMYCKRSSTGIQYKAVVMASDSEKGDLM